MGDKIFTLDYELPNNFGEKIIALDADIYRKLNSILNSNQENIYFRCSETEELISIPNPNKSKPNNASNEKNIVEKWMEDIRDIAETGYQETRESDSERYFSKIKSYCKAVIVSVTS